MQNALAWLKKKYTTSFVLLSRKYQRTSLRRRTHPFALVHPSFHVHPAIMMEDNSTSAAPGGRGGGVDDDGEENGNRGDGSSSNGRADGNSGYGGSVHMFPLLDRLREELPEVLECFVLPELDKTDLAMLARAGREWRATVVSSNLPRARRIAGSRLMLHAFCGSVQRLAWAKANGCPWNHNTCAYAAKGGRLHVLQWAREHGCPWSLRTCARAAEGGYLDVLRWAREHDCPWNEWTCGLAARGGHLDVLCWAREHNCPWDRMTCSFAA